MGRRVHFRLGVNRATLPNRPGGGPGQRSDEFRRTFPRIEIHPGAPTVAAAGATVAIKLASFYHSMSRSKIVSMIARLGKSGNYGYNG